MQDEGDWWPQANCATADPEVFFPSSAQANRDAIQVCGRCYVRTDCLAYAMKQHDLYGIWGGMTAKQRWLRGASFSAGAVGWWREYSHLRVDPEQESEAVRT